MKVNYRNLLLGINELTVKNAEKLLEEDSSSNITFDLTDPIHSIAMYSNGFYTKVEFKEDRIFSHDCQCVVGKNGVICKHIVAAILTYIQKMENSESTDLSRLLAKITDNASLIKAIISLENIEFIFEILIKPFSLSVDIIDNEYVNFVIKNYAAMSKVINTALISENIKEACKKKLIFIENKLHVLKKIYNVYEHYNKENVINKIDLEEFLLGIDRLCKFNINNISNALPLEHHESKEIDINVARTSLGFVITNNIQSGTFLVIGERNFFFLIYEDKIQWFVSDWSESENPNLLFKLNFKSKNEDLFFTKIEEIKNTSYFKPVLHGDLLIQRTKPKVDLFYDFNAKLCVLEIENNNKLAKKYFSKFVDDFQFEPNTCWYETNKKREIAEIFAQIKKIKKNENVIVRVDEALTRKKHHELKYQFSPSKSGLIDLNIKADVDESILEKVYGAYRKDEQFIMVGNELYNTDDFEFDKLKLNLEDIGITKDASLSTEIEMENVFYLSSQFDDDYLRDIVDKFNADVTKYKYVKPKEAPLLKEYQLYGVNWLASILNMSHGCILGDEMGLGKTIQAIHLLKYQYKEKNDPTLIILPLSLITNWVEEFHKFYPDAHVVTISGAKEEREEIINNLESNTFYITTYNLIKNDIELLVKKKFLNVILDEGQYIKNFATGWTKEIKKIKSVNRIILSGTPIENNLLELWSIFDFIMPGYLGTVNEFKRNYYSVDVQEKKLFELSLKIKPFILQRKKIDYLDLPNKKINNVYVKMSDSERNIYDTLLSNFKDTLEVSVDQDQNIVKNRIEILALITKLRQFCCSSQLINIFDEDDSKLNECIHLIETIQAKDPKAKIVLFSNFKSMLELIDKELTNRKNKPLLITGDNKRSDRDAIIEKFKDDQQSNILLISLKVGGVGLNLNFANNVILYNPWWNESAESQAMDRLHRIGQEQEVNVYKLLYENSIESNIEKLKKNKIDIINKTFNQLNFKDLLKLIQED